MRVGLLASAILVGGCETKSTRTCPAFEGHPLLADWAPHELGDTLVYTSDRGGTETYVLASIERSETYDKTDFGDSEDVFCVADAGYLFEASGGDHFILVEYDVIDRIGVERPLYGRVIGLETPDSMPDGPSTFRFLLSDPEADTNAFSSDRQRSSYSRTREIGQVTYEDVFERTLLEPAIDRTTPPETTLTRVVFARDAALVEFERSDGQTFTRVPP